MRCIIAGTQNLKSKNVQEERMICGHENMHTLKPEPIQLGPTCC